MVRSSIIKISQQFQQNAMAIQTIQCNYKMEVSVFIYYLLAQIQILQVKQVFMNIFQIARRTLCFSIPPGKYLAFMSSTNRISLSQSAQRAVWASRIIKEIVQSNPPSTLSEPSRRDHLLQLEINNQSYAFNRGIRAQILKIFTEGILFDKNCMVQQTSNGICIDEFHNRTRSQMLVFWPNYRVTPQIFTALLNAKRSQILFGAGGIGKSTSIGLFCHLASIINKFVIEAHSKKQKSEQLSSLRKDNLVMKVPKYWYQKMDFNKFDSPVRFNNSCQWRSLKQANELTDLQKRSLEHGCQDYYQDRRDYYKRAGISYAFIFDQVDFPQQFLEGMDGQKYNRYREERLSKQMVRVKNCYKYLHQISQLGQFYLFFSKSHFFPQLVYKGIQKSRRGGLQQLKKQIRFWQQGNENWREVDLRHRTWLQIQSNLKKDNNFLRIQEIKNDYYNDLGNANLHNILSDSELTSIVNSAYSQIDIKSQIFLTQLFQKIDQIWINRNRQLWLRFANQRQQHKKLLLALILIAENDQSDPRFIKVDLVKASRWTGIDMQLEYIHNICPGSKFQSGFRDEVHTIKFHWIPRSFLKIFTLNTFNRMFPNANTPFKYRYGANIVSVSTHPFFSALINTLNANIRLSFHSKYYSGSSTELIFDILQKRYIRLEHFYEESVANQKKIYLLEHKLSDILEKAKQYPMFTTLVMPHTSEDIAKNDEDAIKNYHSEEKRIIKRWSDFLLCRFDSQLEQYNFYSFTLIDNSMDVEAESTRMQKLLPLIDSKCKFSIMHVFVLLDARLAEKFAPIKVNQHCEIVGRSFKDIEISSHHKDNQKDLDQFAFIQRRNRLALEMQI